MYSMIANAVRIIIGNSQVVNGSRIITAGDIADREVEILTIREHISPYPLIAYYSIYLSLYLPLICSLDLSSETSCGLLIHGNRGSPSNAVCDLCNCISELKGDSYSTTLIAMYISITS